MTFPLRHMIDQRIVGAGWIAVEGNKSSTCSLKMVARWDRVCAVDIAAARSTT